MITPIEQLEQKLQSSPEYREALERVRRTKKFLTQIQPALSSQAVSTRGKWQYQPGLKLHPHSVKD